MSQALNTQKATRISTSGQCQTATIPSPDPMFNNLEIYQHLFGEYDEAAEKAGLSTKLNLASMMVPFTRLLSPGAKAVLIYHNPTHKDIEKAKGSKLTDAGQVVDDLVNGTATKLTASLEDETRQLILGPAIICYAKPGKDFDPEPDFQCLYEIIAEDLKVVVEHNLEGGELGTGEDTKRQRFANIVGMYKGEMKAKIGKVKDSWEVKVYAEDEFRDEYSPDGRLAPNVNK